MERIIRKMPILFGAVLLIGIVCGTYLLISAIGYFALAYSNPDFLNLFLPPEGRARDLAIYPLAGVFGIIKVILLLFIAVIVCAFVSGVFSLTRDTCKALGNWLASRFAK